MSKRKELERRVKELKRQEECNKKRKTHNVTVPMTFEQIEELDNMRGTQSRSEFIRSTVFNYTTHSGDKKE